MTAEAMKFGVHAENWAQIGHLTRQHATFDAALRQAQSIAASDGYPVGVFRLQPGHHLYEWSDAVAVVGGGSLSGLSGPLDELDFDAEGLPDEPGILDPWAYDAAPAWLIGVGVAFGAASVAAGAWTFWQSWKASR